MNKSDCKLDESVLFNQFSNDFSNCVNAIKESKHQFVQLSSLNSNCSLLSQTGAYGQISQQFFILAKQMQQKLQPSTRIERMVTFGDKLLELEEFNAAATFFYEPLFLQDQQNPPSEYIIRSKYGAAVCRIKEVCLIDPSLLHPENISIIVQQLNVIMDGMKLACVLENKYHQKYSWLILNGSIYIYTFCKPLERLKFFKEIIIPLKWCILCLESVINYCTSRYLNWRIKFYTMLCGCLEELGGKDGGNMYYRQGLSCTASAIEKIEQLRQEEEMDPPVPRDVDELLTNANVAIQIFALKFKQLIENQKLPVSYNQITACFENSNQNKMRTIFENLSKFHSSIFTWNLCDEKANILEYSNFIEETVQIPFSQLKYQGVRCSPAVEEGAYNCLDQVFSLSYHYIFIKVLFRCNYWDKIIVFIDVCRSRLQRIIDSLDNDCNQQSSAPKESLKQVTTKKYFHKLCLAELCVLESISLLNINSENHVGESDAEKYIYVGQAKKWFSIVHLRNVIDHSEDFINGKSGSMAGQCKNDFLINLSLYLYSNFAQELLHNLDILPVHKNFRHRRLLTDLLLLLHRTSSTCKLDDIFLCSNVALRLAILLSENGKKRKVIQILHNTILRIQENRSNLCNYDYHSSWAESNLERLSIASFSIDSTQNVQKGWLSTIRDLSSIEVDIASLQYRTELERAETLYNQYSKKILRNKNQERYKSISSIESRLLVDCKKNGYLKALVLVESAQFYPQGSPAQEQCLQGAVKCIKAMEKEESILFKNLQHSDNKSRVSIPPPPRIVSRGAYCITVQIMPFNFFSKLANPAYFMLFAKSSGAGTDVSLNNCLLPGTGKPIPFINFNSMVWTVNGLTPNESYVFAVAAYDENNQVIGGIGQTSDAVIALNPLPALHLYGKISCLASKYSLNELAKASALELYNVFVSKSGEGRSRTQISPFFCHALRKDIVSEQPIPLLIILAKCLFTLAESECESVISSESEDMLHTVQIETLRKVRMVEIALEISSMTGNNILIMKSAHLIYKYLIILLQLRKRGANYFLQALVSAHQALELVPDKLWSDNIKSLYSKYVYEILLLSRESNEPAISQHCIPSPKLLENSCIKQVLSLKEVLSCSVELYSAVSLKTKSETTPRSRASTPRDMKSDADAGEKIDELIFQNILNSDLVMKTLLTNFQDNARFLELLCKICCVAINNGKISQVTDWIGDIKISLSTFHLSPKNFDIVKCYGLENVFDVSGSNFDNVETKINNDEQADLVASDKVDLKESNSIETETSSTAFSERFLLDWLGEFFFLKAFTSYKEIHNKMSYSTSNDVLNGPDKEIPWELDYLTKKEYNESVLSCQVRTKDFNNSEDEFGLILKFCAASCHFFGEISAWKGIQTCCKILWNSLWTQWISPSQFLSNEDMQEGVCPNGKYDWFPLLQCCNSLLAILSEAKSNDDRIDDMELNFIAKFVGFSLQVFCHVKEWQHLVCVGESFYQLSHEKYSKSLLPLILHAQKEEYNIQKVIVKNSRKSIIAYTQAFHDLQAKKVRKKTRLVVEHVISDEEKLFNCEVERMEKMHEHESQCLNSKKSHLLKLEDLLVNTQKRESKSVVSYNRTTALVKKYIELKQNECKDNYDEKSVQNQIEVSFKSTIEICRHKDEILLLCQAFEKQGDYYFSCNKPHDAEKAWSNGVDVVFGTLHATSHWRSIVAIDENYSSSDDYINMRKNVIQFESAVEKYGIWLCLTCCSLLNKLVELSNDSYMQTECSILASYLIHSTLSCSIPHPEHLYGYANYELSEIWPKLDLFSNPPPGHIHPSTCWSFCHNLPYILIENHKYLEALPIICMLEYLCKYCYHNRHGFVEAKLLKVQTIVQIGFIKEAFSIMHSLVDNSLDEDSITFHNDKSLEDSKNTSALKWLVELSFDKVSVELVNKFDVKLMVIYFLSILKLLSFLSGFTILPNRMEFNPNSTQPKIQEKIYSIISSLQQFSIENEDAMESDLKRKLECCCHLYSSYIAFTGRKWATSQLFVKQAITATVPVSKAEVDQKEISCRIADHSLNIGVLFLLECRVQLMKCEISLQNFESALSECKKGLIEAASVNDVTFSRKLRLLRAKVNVFEGNRHAAEIECHSLLKEYLEDSCKDIEYVNILRFLANLERDKCILDNNPSLLAECSVLLSDAERSLSICLRKSGWIGCIFDQVQLVKFQTLIYSYNPLLMIFAELRHEISFILLNSPLMDNESQLHREGRVDQLIMEALHVLEIQIVYPKKELIANLMVMKANLKVEKYALLNLSENDNLENIASQKSCLVNAINMSIDFGAHDRDLIEVGLMQLSNICMIYSAAKSNEEEKLRETQSSYFYLLAAMKLREKKSNLWNNLQKIASSKNSITKANDFELPDCIKNEILNGAEGSVEAKQILHFYITLLQEKTVIPSDSQYISNILSYLHYYLLGTFSPYGDMCCISKVEDTPSTDAIISQGLVCVQWKKCIAYQRIPEEKGYDMFFILGSSTSDARFGENPYLTKQIGVDINAVSKLHNCAGMVRVQLEDQGSDHLDPGLIQAFEDLQLDIAKFFSRKAQSVLSNEHKEDPADVSKDMNHPKIVLSLETIQILEGMFELNYGVNSIDDSICCFLRDLLEG